MNGGIRLKSDSAGDILCEAVLNEEGGRGEISQVVAAMLKGIQTCMLLDGESYMYSVSKQSSDAKILYGI